MNQVVDALAKTLGITVGAGVGGVLVIIVILLVSPVQKFLKKLFGTPIERQNNIHLNKLQKELDDYKLNNQERLSALQGQLAYAVSSHELRYSLYYQRKFAVLVDIYAHVQDTHNFAGALIERNAIHEGEDGNAIDEQNVKAYFQALYLARTAFDHSKILFSKDTNLIESFQNYLEANSKATRNHGLWRTRLTEFENRINEIDKQDVNNTFDHELKVKADILQSLFDGAQSSFDESKTLLGKLTQVMNELIATYEPKMLENSKLCKPDSLLEEQSDR